MLYQNNFNKTYSDSLIRGGCSVGKKGTCGHFSWVLEYEQFLARKRGTFVQSILDTKAGFCGMDEAIVS